MMVLLPRSLPLLLLSLSLSTTTRMVQANHTASDVLRLDYTTLATTLPQALSDFSVVLDPDHAKAYLTGGCNSATGNRFVAEFGAFVCESISDALYVFDLTTESFLTEATIALPEPRYRHAGVLTNNQVWLVGGRDVMDFLISNVDVYDIASGNWTTYESLDEKYVTSDLAGFADPTGRAYFAGGYSLDYTAQSTVFSIDPIATAAAGDLVVREESSLPTARGDCSGISAVTDEGVPYALVTGGFTHENDFCDPLATTEYYDFESDEWSQVADLLTARGDKALAALDHIVYAIGGERQIPNICLVSTPEPGEETVPVEDVEYWDAATDEWIQIEDLPRHRFRFSAVGYNEKIYSFGGQLAFAEDCQCFRTSNEVTVYTEVFAEEAPVESPVEPPVESPVAAPVALPPVAPPTESPVAETVQDNATTSSSSLCQPAGTMILVALGTALWM